MQNENKLNDFRCSNNKCRQLQYKYKLQGNILKIEIKCYACNSFSYMTINLNTLSQKNDSSKK